MNTTTHRQDDQIELVLNSLYETALTDHLTVVTPIALCREMLGQIKLKGKKILVLNVEWLFGLSNEELNNTTYISTSTDRIAFVNAIFPMVTTILGNILKMELNMKFDVVIGNPPYQQGRNRTFYREFIEVSWTLSRDIVAMITPSNWTSTARVDNTFTQNLINRNLIMYKYLGDKAFPVQLMTVYFITSKKDKTDSVTLIAENDQITIPRNELKYFPTTSTNNMDLISKLASTNYLTEIHGSLTRGRSIISNLPNAIGCIYTAGTANGKMDKVLIDPSQKDELAGIGEHKVIVTHQTSVGNLGVVKYASPEFGIGLSAHAFVVESEEEAENLIAYLNSNVVKFLFKKYKGAVASNSQGLFKHIPMVPLNIKMDDNDVYSYFNLTDSEIKSVEQTIS